MKKPLLNDITIEITNHCQLHCQHCGIWAEKDRHEMSSSLVVRMMRQLLARYEVYFVSITGGEPFLNRNCGRVLKAMSFFRRRGQISGFGVYSNAAYFEGVRRVMTAYGKDLSGMHMGISIDGRQEVHDRLRGPGAFGKSLKTIEWLAAHFGKDIILEFKFTINRLNYAELGDVYRMARRFKARFSPKIMESGVDDYYHRHEMPQAGQLASLTPAMVEDVRGQVEAMLKDNYAGVDNRLVKAMMVLLAGGRKCIRACETPAKSLFINSRRNVFPCLYMEPAGKLGDQGQLPQELDLVRQRHAEDAAQGHCPGCFAYHGFLKKFNLPYLQAQDALPFQPR
ncbi:MAG: radical SAM protein [Candidatus Omnitrophica bacterium]|nr:radical SAM protein [Candidatus Omnitrophota bacterium]